jgi:hypothetical protein
MITLDCMDHNAEVARLTRAVAEPRLRGEWPRELRTLPAARNRTGRRAEILLGVLQLALIMPKPADGSRYRHSRGEN